IASMDAAELGAFFRTYAELLDLGSRVGNYAHLHYAVDSTDPATGALVARVDDRSTRVQTRLLFIELEWAAVDDAHADAILSDPTPELDLVRHHLRSARRMRPHLLTEPEERIDTEKDAVGVSAW